MSGTLEARIAQAVSWLDRQQHRLESQHHLFEYGQYFYDLETMQIHFGGDDRPPLTFSFVLIGSWNETDGDFLWAWANQNLPPSVRTVAGVYRKLSKQLADGTPADRAITCDSDRARALCAMACKQSKALGLFRVKREATHILLALLEHERVNAAEGGNGSAPVV